MRGGKKKQNIPFFWFYVRGEERERGRKLQLLSMIFGDRVVGISRAKSESLSTRQGLPMVPKRRGFIEDPREEISGNQNFRD